MGLIKIFFSWDTEIIGAVIAFIGAVLGGVITYFGVRITLEHRDKEIFLTSVTEKLLLIDGLINTYKVYINAVFMLENSNMGIDERNKRIFNLAKSILEQLNEDNEKIYKSMEYESIQIIDVYKKTLNGMTFTSDFTKEKSESCIEKFSDIFNVIHLSKEQLEKKYYEYKS